MFQRLQGLYRGSDVSRLNAPKDDIRVSHQSSQVVAGVVRTHIDQETTLRGPFFEQLFRRFGTDICPVLEEKFVRDSVLGSPTLIISGNARGLAKLLQSSSQLLCEGTTCLRVMNDYDDGRLRKLAIDHNQLLDDVGGDAKHRELEVGMLGRQAKQFVQRQANNGCRLNGLDLEM